MKSNLILVVLLFTISNFANAGGNYNPDSAVQYANQYALNPNSAYPNFSSDCTNFVSQSLRAGGLYDDSSVLMPITPLTGAGSTTTTPIYVSDPWSPYNWYFFKKDPFSGTPAYNTFSATWSVANQSYKRLRTGADSWKYAGSYKIQSVNTNIPVNYGDIVYADWTDDAIIDHAMIVTGFQYKNGN